MKKVFAIMLLIMILTTGCLENAKTVSDSENEINQNCFKLYSGFLNGEIGVSSDTEDTSEIDIKQLFRQDENYNKYTMFDSNHNGVPELHLSSMREYMILESIKGKLTIIYSGSGYEKLLNNGALLYSRPGGASEHISYIYTELNLNDKITQIAFEKYNTLNDNVDDDMYLFDGSEVIKSDFDTKTKKYLSVESGLIIWSDYWVYLVENANHQ